MVVHDPALVEHVSAFPPDQRPDEVAKILAVGVRGIAAMGLTASVA